VVTGLVTPGGPRRGGGDEYGRQVALAHADTLEQPGNPNTTRLLNILVGVR